MDTSLERLGEATVKLTVTVPADEVDAAVEEAYKRMAGKLKVPGFRKGKAPKPVIDTHVGREAVLADAQDDLLNESYGKALDAEGLRPIAQPEIGEIDLIEPGEPFEYEAEVEIRPEFTLSSIDDLAITVPPATASDREVDAQIEHTRERFASLETLEGRTVVEANDFVLLSFVGLVDGEAYEGNTVDQYLYEMNAGLMPTEFDDGLIGVEVGGETQVSFEIPDTSSNEEFVGKTATFDVTVHEIKTKVLPEVDDEFAVTSGGFDTLDEMRTAVREQLDRSKQMGHDRALEREARAELAKRAEGDVPDAMVETTKEQMMRDFVSGLEAREMDVNQYLQATGTDSEKLESDIAEQAAASVREELALEALFRQLDMEVIEADIDEELALFAGNTERSPEELRASWEETGVMPVLTEQIMHKKAVLWLLENVDVTEEEDAGPDADEKIDTQDSEDEE